MNSYEMVLGIVIVVMIASVLKSIFRGGGGRRRRMGEDPEAAQLKAEVQKLRDRLHVLERIATDKESQLEREIERLRDR